MNGGKMDKHFYLKNTFITFMFTYVCLILLLYTMSLFKVINFDKPLLLYSFVYTLLINLGNYIRSKRIILELEEGCKEIEQFDAYIRDKAVLVSTDNKSRLLKGKHPSFILNDYITIKSSRTIEISLSSSLWKYILKKY